MVKAIFKCHFLITNSQITFSKQRKVYAFITSKLIQIWVALILTVVSNHFRPFIDFNSFVITCKKISESCFLVTLCLGLTLSIFFDSTELCDYFSLLSSKGRLREVTLSFWLVAIVLLLIIFFRLLQWIDSIIEKIGLRLIDVGNEAMDKGIIAVIVNFDHWLFIIWIICIQIWLGCRYSIKILQKAIFIWSWLTNYSLIQHYE